jgi:hypothetical protein
LIRQEETDSGPASAAPSLGRVNIEEILGTSAAGGFYQSERLEQGLLVGVISEDWPAWLEVRPSLEITSLVITYILAWESDRLHQTLLAPPPEDDRDWSSGFWYFWTNGEAPVAFLDYCMDVLGHLHNPSAGNVEQAKLLLKKYRENGTFWKNGPSQEEKKH